MVSDLITSLIRTAVPTIVGAIVSYLTVVGIQTPHGVAEWLISVLFFAFTLGYYAIVRLLENKYPKIGWLLGNPAKPTYTENIK